MTGERSRPEGPIGFNGADLPPTVQIDITAWSTRLPPP